MKTGSIKTKTLNLVVGCLFATSALGNVDFSDPNTSFFSVSDFRYPAGVEVRSFSASGFFTPATGPYNARVVVLPSISLHVDEAKYLDENGLLLDPDAIQAGVNVGFIHIPITYIRTLPNDIEGTAIASQVINSTRLEGYYADYPSAGFNLPAIDSFAQNYPQITHELRQQYADYQQKIAAQKQTTDLWKKIDARLANMDSLEVALSINGATVARRRVNGSAIIAGQQLPSLSIAKPSILQVNLIRQGLYDVEINYFFRDSHTGSIDVNQNYALAMDNYIRESRQVITQSRSSGWSIFNIGSRRTSVSQHINEAAVYNSSYDQKTNTSIVIEDADDALIRYFEDQFFPQLTRLETINSHLEAAQLATQSGNTALAKAHRDYAAALQQGDQASDAELDSIGAAAALGQGNYAMFIAKGVRFKDTATSQFGSFHRVISQNVREGIDKTWTATRTRSVKRKVTTVLSPDAGDVEYRGYAGICGVNTFQLPHPYSMHTYLIPTCMHRNSPLHAAGILPGTFIVSVDYKQVNTPQKFLDILEQQRFGDSLDFKVIEMDPAFGPRETVKTVVLGRGAKIPAGQ